MLTGAPPFDGRTESDILYRQVHEPPPPVISYRPDAPLAVEEVFDRALAERTKQSGDWFAHVAPASFQEFYAAVRDHAHVYGVNTGFGQLATVRIPDEHLGELQLNLVRSHCAGVGEPLPERVVRAILALRANCLARGHSGLRLETLERILAMLDAGICPVVPSQGSVGAFAVVGDDVALASAMLARLAGDPERGTLARRAEHFSVARSAERYLEVFEAVVADRGARAAAAGAVTGG